MILTQFRVGKYVLALLVPLFIAGCFPTSEHAITGTPMENLDATFSGIWKGTLGQGPATLLFMQQSQDDTGTTHIGGLVVGHHEERPSLNEGWLEFEGEVVVIRGEVFLSVLLNQMDAKPTDAAERGYYLFRVKLKDDTMCLMGLDELVVAELVNRGAIDGVVDRSRAVPSVRLSSSGNDLRGFLNNADLDEVFSSSFARFTRTR